MWSIDEDKRGDKRTNKGTIEGSPAIGRATTARVLLGCRAILLVWHEGQDTRHLEHVAEVRDQAGEAGERLEVFALISHEHRGNELAHSCIEVRRLVAVALAAPPR